MLLKEIHWEGKTYLQKNIVSLRAFQCPLAIAEGCIFMRVIRTLHDVATARHIILAISRTVQFIGIIAAIVLLVAFERRVDALAVRAVERTCGCIIVTGRRMRIIIPFRAWNTESQVADSRDGRTYRKGRRWHDTWKEEVTRTWSIPTFVGRPSRRRLRTHPSVDSVASAPRNLHFF